MDFVVLPEHRSRRPRPRRARRTEDRRRGGCALGRSTARNGSDSFRSRSFPSCATRRPSYYDWLAHPEDGPYWDFANVEARYEEIEIPALNLSGWHDEGYGPAGAIRNYRGTRDNGSRLSIGPWRHGTPRLDRIREGELDFGVNAGLDHDALLLRWFDHYLKEDDNGIEREKPVSIFVMGENAWREEDDWPLARRVETAYYLRSGGKLSLEPPRSDEAPDEYAYDPLDPVVDPHGGAQGPYDQSPLETRQDLLVYQTEPLAKDVEVTGHIEAELFVSSSAKDTDFVVRLLDVHPDGRAFNLMSPTVEVVRARYREGEKEEDAPRAGRGRVPSLRSPRDLEPVPRRPPHPDSRDLEPLSALRSQPEYRRAHREERPHGDGAPGDPPQRFPSFPYRAARDPSLTSSGSERAIPPPGLGPAPRPDFAAVGAGSGFATMAAR